MLIRPTHVATSQNMVNQALGGQSALYNLQLQMAAQKKFLNPSENVVGTATLMMKNNQLSNIDGYLSNINLAQGEMSTLDGIFASATDKLQRINDLAIQASTGTSSDETLKAIKAEITEIKKDLIHLANTNYNGQYIFAGANTETAPFSLDEATGEIKYAGTATLNPDGTPIVPQVTSYQRKMEISDNLTMVLNFPGDDVFGFYDPSTTPPEGAGLFKVISDLETAINAVPADHDTVRAQLDPLQAQLARVNDFRAKEGIKAKRLDTTESALNDSILLLKEQKSEIEDIDIAKAVSDLSNLSYSYEASLKIASSLMQSSLLNYM